MTQSQYLLLFLAGLLLFDHVKVYLRGVPVLLRISVAATLVAFAFDGSATGAVAAAIAAVIAFAAVLQSVWCLLRAAWRFVRRPSVKVDTRFEFHGTEAVKAALAKTLREIH